MRRTAIWRTANRWSRSLVWPRQAFVVGTVLEASTGHPSAGATVETIPRNGSVTEFGIATDERGRYVNVNVDAPGTYELRVAADGYAPATKTVRGDRLRGHAGGLRSPARPLASCR